MATAVALETNEDVLFIAIVEELLLVWLVAVDVGTVEAEVALTLSADGAAIFVYANVILMLLVVELFVGA